MTLEEFRTVHQREPFHPFALHVADGRRLTVAARQHVAEFPHGRTIIVIQPDAQWNLLDLSLVTGVEYEPEAAPPGEGNGKAKA